MIIFTFGHFLSWPIMPMIKVNFLIYVYRWEDALYVIVIGVRYWIGNLSWNPEQYFISLHPNTFGKDTVLALLHQGTNI